MQIKCLVKILHTKSFLKYNHFSIMLYRIVEWNWNKKEICQWTRLRLNLRDIQGMKQHMPMKLVK